MQKTLLLFLGFMVLFTNCISLNLNSTSTIKTTQQVHLGSVGYEKDFILNSGFSTTAVPRYKEPVKVMAIAVPFNKATYNAYVKAKALQSANVAISIIDSIAEKPKYLKLEIADKVELIDALNGDENKNVKTYLSHNNSANILSSVSIAFSALDIENIIAADAIFLMEKGLKAYVLQLYKDGIKTQTVQFNQGVIFEYKTSYCCWQKTKTQQYNIVALVSGYDGCPKETYRSLKHARKTNDYYKL